MIGGMRIVPHPLAVKIAHEVQPHPIKKRRRGWRVVRVESPSCLQMGGTLFMHPDLIALLPK